MQSGVHKKEGRRVGRVIEWYATELIILLHTTLKRQDFSSLFRYKNVMNLIVSLKWRGRVRSRVGPSHTCNTRYSVLH